MESKVTVLLPAYNEEQSIGKVISEIREANPGWCNILVGDNCSTDKTREIALAKGTNPILITDRGKGKVIRTLLTQVDTPYVVMVDSDYTYPIGDNLRALLGFLEFTEADVVVCPRRWIESGAMSKINRIGNKLLSLLASILYRDIEDICSGMWGFRKETLDKFSLTSDGFTLEADLFVNAVANKCHIVQLPIRYRARLNGSKPKLKIWDGFRIGWFLIKRRFR